MLPKFTETWELLKKSVTSEQQSKILELREEMLRLWEENISLKEKVKTLQEEAKVKGNLSFDGSVYWKTEDNQKDGPFCQCCYDTDKTLVRLQESSVQLSPYNTLYEWGFACRGCKSEYQNQKER